MFFVKQYHIVINPALLLLKHTCESEHVLPPFCLKICCCCIFGSRSDNELELFDITLGCSLVFATIFATGLGLFCTNPFPSLGNVPPLAVKLLAECWCIKIRSGLRWDSARIEFKYYVLIIVGKFEKQHNLVINVNFSELFYNIFCEKQQKSDLLGN